VNLHPPLQFYGRPFLFEFLHHLSPNEHVVVVALLNLSFSLFLELIKPVCLLDHRRFLN
jgi:hypothetical protein